jgi:hypothetical protein
MMIDFARDLRRPIKPMRRQSMASRRSWSAFRGFGRLACAAHLCVKHHRTVGNDNCIRFGKLDLQIPEQRHRRHYVRVTVEVRQYDDGALAIFHGPRRLADYTPDGVLINGESKARSAA